MNKNNLRFVRTSGITLALASLLSACGGDTTTPQPTPSSTAVSSSSTASVVSSYKSSVAASSSSVAGNNGSGLAVNKNWYVELPNGRGTGVNYEAVAYTDDMGFDKDASLAAFKQTVYPILRENCAGCHSSDNTKADGAQAPLHSDKDPALAHEYALTRVNFRDPAASKLVFRQVIDRHNCFSTSCKASGAQLEAAIKEWAKNVSLPEISTGAPAATKFTDEQIQGWIDADKAKLSAADKEFIQYASFHVMHNNGVSPLNMNHARVALSKALNTAARWAPEVVSPKDVTGQGILYKFDIRDYWGHTKVDTSASNFKLFFGGSDDDLAFGAGGNKDANGNTVAFGDLNNMKNKLKSAVGKDDKFARLAWARILKGNVEGADEKNVALNPNINGFVGKRTTQTTLKQDYIKPEDFKYA
jgi:mono/diheme cytochrome c family protein